jgi:hypothetical protein
MQHKLSDTTMVAEFIPQPQSVRSRLCSYSKTAAHQYFVSRKTELYLKYGCSINGILECWIGEGMYPLCYHHHQRVVQWNKETNPDTDLKCHSVWDIDWKRL